MLGDLHKTSAICANGSEMERTETTLDPETSATVIFLSLAAARSMWSEPTPAVLHLPQSRI